MIKITVDTEEELNNVREALKDIACTNTTCSEQDLHIPCSECMGNYFKSKVLLYKKEIVEIPAPIVV